MTGLNLEIWFPQQDEVSVFLESSVVDAAEERYLETSLFALYATRQLANLRGDWIASTLAEALADLDVDEAEGQARRQLGDVQLVPPSSTRGRKGFTAQLRPEKRGFFKLNPRGFGVLGKGVQYYAPTSTLALLTHLLSRRSDDREYGLALAMTAKAVGYAGRDDAIGITTSAMIAMKAAATGWEFAIGSSAEVENDLDESPAQELGAEAQLRVIAAGQGLASQYGVDLVDLSNYIVEQLAALRDSDPSAGAGPRAFPIDALRGMCGMDFVAASGINDPRLDEAFAQTDTDHAWEMTLRVLDDHGLTPVVDALCLLITTDDPDVAL